MFFGSRCFTKGFSTPGVELRHSISKRETAVPDGEAVGDSATMGVGEAVGDSATMGVGEAVGDSATVGVGEAVGVSATVGVGEAVGNSATVGVGEAVELLPPIRLPCFRITAVITDAPIAVAMINPVIKEMKTIGFFLCLFSFPPSDF